MTRQATDRITHDAAVMGGRRCIRGMRVTVGAIAGLLATGKTEDEVLAAYPYIEREDIQAALAFGAMLEAKAAAGRGETHVGPRRGTK